MTNPTMPALPQRPGNGAPAVQQQPVQQPAQPMQPVVVAAAPIVAATAMQNQQRSAAKPNSAKQDVKMASPVAEVGTDVKTEVKTDDDLLASISRNFGSNGSNDTVSKAKRDSLAAMNKHLPDWNLEPPETFLQ